MYMHKDLTNSCWVLIWSFSIKVFGRYPQYYNALTFYLMAFSAQPANTQPDVRLSNILLFATSKYRPTCNVLNERDPSSFKMALLWDTSAHRHIIRPSSTRATHVISCGGSSLGDRANRAQYWSLPSHLLERLLLQQQYRNYLPYVLLRTGLL